MKAPAPGRASPSVMSSASLRSSSPDSLFKIPDSGASSLSSQKDAQWFRDSGDELTMLTYADPTTLQLMEEEEPEEATSASPLLHDGYSPVDPSNFTVDSIGVVVASDA